MRKKLLMALCTCIIMLSAFTGCGEEKQKAADVVAPTEAPTATPEPTATPTPVPLKTIGTKADGAYEIQIKNATGREIKGVAVKSIQETEYTQELLAENDAFAIDEERILYYKPEEATPEEQDADAKVMTPGYDIRVTFADDNSTAELHAFPFEDMEKAEIHAADGVAYLTYESVSTKSVVDTKAAELAILAQTTQNAQEAAAAAAAASDAAAQQTQTYNSDTNESYYEEPVYEEPTYEEPSYEEPSYEEPSYEEPADGGDDSCLEGGLVY